MQQNILFRLYGDKDETINYIISECSKQAQRDYKTRDVLKRKVIHRELSKKLRFDHTIKWYIHKPESVKENETYKIL